MYETENGLCRENTDITQLSANILAESFSLAKNLNYAIQVLHWFSLQGIFTELENFYGRFLLNQSLEAVMKEICHMHRFVYLHNGGSNTLNHLEQVTPLQNYCNTI